MADDGFLVLNRRDNERIIIKVPPNSKETQITVAVKRDQEVDRTRVAIQAPKSVNIIREELDSRKPNIES